MEKSAISGLSARKYYGTGKTVSGNLPGHHRAQAGGGNSATSEREKAILHQIASVFLTSPDEKIYEEVLAVILKVLKCRYGIFGYIGDSGDLIIPSMTKEIWSDCRVEGSRLCSSASMGKQPLGQTIKEKKSFSSEGPFQTPEGIYPLIIF